MSATPALDWSKTKMKYRHLGRSGLKVSCLSLGTWTTVGGTTEQETAHECLTVALKNGVNFFDTAEVYSAGKSEIELGKSLQRWFTEGLCKRSDLVIATKIFWGAAFATGNGNPNATGLSRKHIIEGVDASLSRLQLSYVDLIFCHRPDPSTPIEETVRAMNHVINSGKAFYWGTSEWPAADIVKAHSVAEKLGLVGPVMEQPQYNLLWRDRFEVEYAPVFAQYGMGTTTWSPLACGLLSGKYGKGVIPEGSRLSHPDNAVVVQIVRRRYGDSKSSDVASDAVFSKIDALKPIAEKLGCTLAVLSIAWCLVNKNVSTVITGASRPSQVEENLKALDVVDKLTEEVLGEIDAAIGTKPAAAYDWGRGSVRWQ